VHQVLYICGGICACSYVFVYFAMFMAAPFLEGVDRFTVMQLHTFCSLTGCLMMARSPASAIAVLKVSTNPYGV
jgi:hypothetical protein